MVAIVFAAVQATASLTIRWNTRPAPAPKPAATQSGTLVSLHGGVAEVRMPDGSLRHFFATGSESTALRALVGHSISFIVK